MKKGWVLYKKEMQEYLRSYKWLWIPLVFILIGVMQPIETYYQPQILDLAGVSKEAIKVIPELTATQVMVKVLSQYNLMGMLILVLSSMSIVSSERSNGTAQLILVRPVAFKSFILAKWFTVITVITISFILSYVASWYYTQLLIGEIKFTHIVGSGLIYLLWLIFVSTLTILFSSIFKASGSIAFLVLVVSAVLSVVTSTLTKYMGWSPSRITNHASSYLLKGHVSDHFTLCITVTVVAIVSLLLASIWSFKSHDLGAER